MPLLFFIDKDVLDDPACKGVDDVVLSYTFFRFVLSLACSVFVLMYGSFAVRGGMREDIWNLTPRMRRCKSRWVLVTMNMLPRRRYGLIHRRLNIIINTLQYSSLGLNLRSIILEKALSYN